MKQRSIHGLDLVRFIAASLVMLFHFRFAAWGAAAGGQAMNSSGHASAPWPGLIASGWIGVQIFFVLSGFVIANSANGSSSFGFAAGRVRRLVPAAWICATVALAIAIAHHDPLRQTLALWRNMMVFYPLGPWLLTPFWTLPVEIAFYALITVLLAGDRFRWMQGVAATLAVLCLAYWLTIRFGGVEDGHMRVTRLFLLQHGCYFAMGMIGWQVWKFGATPPRLAILVAAAATSVLQIDATRHSSEAQGLAMPPLTIPLLAFALAMVALWASVRFNDRLTVLDRHARLVRTLGLATYPLYLIHLPVGVPIASKWISAGGGTIGALFASSAVVILVAVVIAQWLEPIGQRQIANGFGWIGARIAARAGESSVLLRRTARLEEV